MREIEPPFDLEWEGNSIKVSEHELAGKRIFHIHFNDDKKPLVITVGLGLGDQKFWTSIPQGRQSEAEQIGKLIAAYIRAKRK
ncbi:hypothetical protein [Pedobacter nyackensis]|uniref:hypothetical protein n=1 Tax=Pedobacter nyackensis TaxID=475255 RepID=UPI002930E59F|nr:hypothetical protein [Pedobacter nyackensis]